MIGMFFGAVVFALTTSQAVVVSADNGRSPNNAETIVSVGKHSVVAAAGPDKLNVNSAKGGVDYSFAKLVDEVKAKAARDASPVEVAETVRASLAGIFARYQPGPIRFPDVMILVAGIGGDGTPSVWTVRTLREGNKLDVVKEPLHTSGGIDSLALGFKKPAQTMENMNRHPKQPGKGYTAEDMAEISAGVIADEGRENPFVGMPVRQMVLMPSKDWRREWSPAQGATGN